MAAQTHLPPFWIPKTLAPLGAKPGIENTRVLEAQALAEGGTAKWNPLNSSLASVPIGPNYNDVPVRNYLFPVVGICMTAMTFAGRDSTGILHYPGILGDLQNGTKTAEQIVNDNWDEYLTWGTDPATMLEVLKDV